MKDFAQLGNASSYTTDCGNPIVSTVPVLFFSGGPLAILWRIIFTIVDSIYRLALRLFSHVSKKVLKHLPPFADLYSSTTVVWKGVLVWVSASVLHLTPNEVSLGLFDCMSMLKIKSDSNFGLKKSARFCVTVSENPCSNRYDRSTITKTSTHCFMSSIWFYVRRSVSNHNELSKPGSWWHRLKRHGNRILNVVFSSGRRAVTRARCEYDLFTKTVNI